VIPPLVALILFAIYTIGVAVRQRAPRAKLGRDLRAFPTTRYLAACMLGAAIFVAAFAMVLSVLAFIMSRGYVGLAALSITVLPRLIWSGGLPAIAGFGALAALIDIKARTEPPRRLTFRIAIPVGALLGALDVALAFRHTPEEGVLAYLAPLPYLAAAGALAGSFAGWRVCAYLTGQPIRAG
jgi:ABC-type multidrug transport system permease subunit